jgi:ectoine hydroxylase-related dioxygenase (phytanoyl-CoA dioxygenase family)
MDRQAVERARLLTKRSIGAVRGLARFLAGKELVADDWSDLLDLHCMTNGRSTNMMTSAMRAVRPPKMKIVPFQSMLGSFSIGDVDKIAEDIRRDGYFVFENRIPLDVCDGILEAASRLEGRAGRKADSKMAIFDARNPIGHVYDIPEKESLKVPEVQKLISDPVFVNVAQAYFRAQPSIMSSLLWWSPVMDGTPDTDAAQLFHFDFDPAPIWIKFFVYLSDVTSTSGPHVFVRGSHKRQLPASRDLLARHYVRIPDHEIEAAYGKDNVVELTGKRGTVIAVDTSGFHKGKAPSSDHRLLAQIVVSTPLFVGLNAGTVPLPPNISPELSRALRTMPWAYERYRT